MQKLTFKLPRERRSGLVKNVWRARPCTLTIKAEIESPWNSVMRHHSSNLVSQKLVALSVGQPLAAAKLLDNCYQLPNC